MNREKAEKKQAPNVFVELLGVDPTTLRDDYDAIEAYHAELARKWADGESHFRVDASTIGDDGFAIGYFDGESKSITASIHFSYETGCDIECGNFHKQEVDLDLALTLTKTLNEHLTPEGRDKLFSQE